MRRLIGEPFELLGGVVIDPDMVLPAALPLDLCGESVRARLCLFTDHNNRDMALRPDLTLPVALAEIDLRNRTGLSGENVHRYGARAFRQPAVPGEPMEFTQVGFERFGAPSSAEIDAETYALVSEASVAAGVSRGVARFGDLSIVPAFIEALDLQPSVKAGLRRAFREAGGVSAYLKLANRPRDAFIDGLAGLDREAVGAALAAKREADGVLHFGNRTEDEVVARLLEQANEGAAGKVSAKTGDVLEAVLTVECHPREAATRLTEIAAQAGLSGLDGLISQLGACFGTIERAAPQFLDGARFSPAFGRRFTYYDGFVFEIGETGERGARPFGAGGRYDRLLSDLSGGSITATAIGGVVRPDRLELAREASA